LPPCNFFLFPKSKISLKGTDFQPTEDIHQKTAEVLTALKQISEDAWRPERLAWGGVYLPMEITLKQITCRYNKLVKRYFII
jgi:hypothetical protein